VTTPPPPPAPLLQSTDESGREVTRWRTETKVFREERRYAQTPVLLRGDGGAAVRVDVDVGTLPLDTVLYSRAEEHDGAPFPVAKSKTLRRYFLDPPPHFGTPGSDREPPSPATPQLSPARSKRGGSVAGTPGAAPRSLVKMITRTLSGIYSDAHSGDEVSESECDSEAFARLLSAGLEFEEPWLAAARKLPEGAVVLGHRVEERIAAPGAPFVALGRVGAGGRCVTDARDAPLVLAPGTKASYEAGIVASSHGLIRASEALGLAGKAVLGASLLYALVAVGAAVAFPAPSVHVPPGAELLSNGGFEDVPAGAGPGSADAIFPWYTSPEGSATLSTPGYEGRWALVMRDTAGGASLRQDVAVQLPGCYRLSFAYRAAEDPRLEDIEVTFGPRGGGGAPRTLARVGATHEPSSALWTPTSVFASAWPLHRAGRGHYDHYAFAVPETGVYTLSFASRSHHSGALVNVLDSVSLTKEGERACGAVGREALANPTFSTRPGASDWGRGVLTMSAGTGKIALLDASGPELSQTVDLEAGCYDFNLGLFCAGAPVGGSPPCRLEVLFGPPGELATVHVAGGADGSAMAAAAAAPEALKGTFLRVESPGPRTVLLRSAGGSGGVAVSRVSLVRTFDDKCPPG